MQQERGRLRVNTREMRSGTEFLGVLPLSAVALFALNNFVFKHSFPGTVTGKLSDFLCCFFLPLFLSAVLGRVLPWKVQIRVQVGIVVTALVFTAVKSSVNASRVLNAGIAALTFPVGLHLVPNQADLTDLVALPMVVVAWIYARLVFAENTDEHANASPC